MMPGCSTVNHRLAQGRVRKQVNSLAEASEHAVQKKLVRGLLRLRRNSNSNSNSNSSSTLTKPEPGKLQRPVKVECFCLHMLKVLEHEMLFNLFKFADWPVAVLKKPQLSADGAFHEACALLYTQKQVADVLLELLAAAAADTEPQEPWVLQVSLACGLTCLRVHSACMITVHRIIS